MLKSLIATLFCAVIGTTATGASHNVPLDEPIATVQTPDKWQTKEYEERIEVSSPDSAISFMVVLPEGSKIAEAMGETMRYIRNRDGIVVQSDSFKKESDTLNGVKVQNVSWQGKGRKGEVEIKFVVLKISEN